MADLASQLQQLKEETLNELNKVNSEKNLQSFKQNYLGKSGYIKKFQKEIGKLNSSEERKKIGLLFNQLLEELNKSLTVKSEQIKEQKVQELTDKDWVDVSLPGKYISYGHLHPITQIRQRAEDIFERMGFEIVLPRKVDSDFHVFEALNIPAGHPARDLWDTFWTEDGYIPITHTSAMQHRIISSHEPPIRAIVPGRCFRHEATDATHEHTFYQIEGVYVDKNITLADLIGTLKTFLSSFYQREVNLKIQPSYFPFVEPGLEIMIDCVICKGQDGYCSTCRGKRWIELVPAGPIHPEVLIKAGMDPEQFSGFAWGLGLDRLAMIEYGIEDLRWFHSGDLRFLQQF